MRNMVFVSHANPEDNEFALWLSLQLAREGYPVWCDLAKLLGGEDFWRDAEAAIRERTAKFLYVLSRTSNDKEGPLGELQIAKNVQRDDGLRDFVIPVLIDDLPPRLANIRLANINLIPFRDGWAPALAQLFKKLEEDNVPKDTRFSPAAVAQWWREQYRPDAGVRREPEPLMSNWLRVTAPLLLYFHELSRSGVGSLTVPDDLPYPAMQHEQYLVAFAPAESFAGRLGPGLAISSSRVWPVAATERTDSHPPWTPRQERDGLTLLLRQAWQHLLRVRGLPTYTFANGAVAFYFRKEMVPNDEIRFVGVNGSPATRAILGYRTIKGPDGAVRGLRYWHFALQAKSIVAPFLGFAMKPHVLFSSDGWSIWESKDRLHRARRSQCRNWWNDTWRDRLLAAIHWLAGDGQTIHLPVGDDLSIEVAKTPFLVTAVVSYAEETALPPDEAAGVATDDDGEEESDVGDMEDLGGGS
jgi:TIR domain-containing protein